MPWPDPCSKVGALGVRADHRRTDGRYATRVSTLSDALVGYQLTLDEQFDGSDIDRERWFPHYLPHWAGRERSRARYRLTGDALELFVARDQPPWLPEVTGCLRVSSLQTGSNAGPVGSTIGQHRTDDRLVVVEQQPEQRLVTPVFGAVELRASWDPGPDCMVALWMIGIEDEPNRSAEICICEIFGSEATDDMALVGMGVHPYGDPIVTDDFDKVPAHIDIRVMHDYGMIWTPQDVTFFIDGEPAKRVEQSPQYPMQLMLSIYDFSCDTDRPPCRPFVVDHIRIHEPV